MKSLIIKTSSLGDIIHAFPVANYLGEVDWVVEERFSELLEANPRVNRILKVDTKSWRKGKRLGHFRRFVHGLRSEKYDVVFDLQGNCKSALFTKLARAPHKVGFGRKSVPEWPNLLVTNRKFNPPPGQNIRADYLYLVQRFCRDSEPFTDPGVVLEGEPVALDFPSPSLLVCPGSAWPNKQVTFEALLNFCRQVEDYHFLWVWGSEEEKRLAKSLQRAFPDTSQVVPRLSLPALQNLMSRVDLVFAVDSLALHLCGTTNTPSFSVFGPSSAAKYKPMGAQHTHLQGSCPYGRTFEKRCPILRKCATGLCTRGITGDQLYQAYASRLR